MHHPSKITHQASTPPLQVEREARVKEAIAKLEKETRDRSSEESQKAREIEELKKEKKEREKASARVALQRAAPAPIEREKFNFVTRFQI